MDAIGGYFELELRKGAHYHKDAIRLNSGRNCFEYILRARGYRKVYMPYYTCQVMYDTANAVGVEIAYYLINELLEPAILPQLESDEAILYTNYYGLKQRYVEKLAKYYGTQLIVDNAQAFYAKPIAGIDTFYSPRKFFGVPDGGYLYTNVRLNETISQAESLLRMKHLLKRIEQGAESGYADYQEAEASLDNRPIERMSKLTDALLSSIDYVDVAACRKRNYEYLSQQLGMNNLIHLPLEPDAVPMVYPYMTGDSALRKRLIENKVYIATYWPNVDNRSLHEMILKTNLLPLPIDQRYTNLDKLIEIIRNE
jgi:hypothetical protein